MVWGDSNVEKFRHYDIDHKFCSQYVMLMVLSLCNSAPIKTEDNWINETKYREQSQLEVICETQDVSI